MFPWFLITTQDVDFHQVFVCRNMYLQITMHHKSTQSRRQQQGVLHTLFAMKRTKSSINQGCNRSKAVLLLKQFIIINGCTTYVFLHFFMFPSTLPLIDFVLYFTKSYRHAYSKYVPSLTCCGDWGYVAPTFFGIGCVTTPLLPKSSLHRTPKAPPQHLHNLNINSNL